MSRTYRKKDVSWSSPREIQQKRPKQALQREIEDEYCPWCPDGKGTRACRCGFHNKRKA